MNWHEEENKTKLHILNSLARSQRALACIIESMAETAKSPSAGLNPHKLSEQTEAISRLQRQLMERITGIRIRKFRQGRPGKPWLHSALRKSSSL